VSASNFVGAGILSVAPGSVADKAGIKTGDIVSEFAETPIANARQLNSYIGRMSPGALAVVKLRRNKKDVVVTARF
jgi:S1-C subfamily serine protease